MQDSPSSSEMLEAIISLLKERIAPQVSGHDSYALRVAINSLGTVKREAEFRSSLESKEHQRLESILGKSGTIGALNSELCEKIRSGVYSLKDRDIVEHLKQTAMDQVSIDQPKYSGLVYAQEQKSECPAKAPPAP